MATKPYRDPKTTKIEDWKWRPLEQVQEQLGGLREIPDYIQKGFGGFMAEQAGRSKRGEMTPRDLIKAYTIAQSSIGRGGLSRDTATKTGMKLPNTGGEVRPEGAFAEWLGSPAGQKYLNLAERGTADMSAIGDLQGKFAPFGKQNDQAEKMVLAAKMAQLMGPGLNQALTGSTDDYRDYAEKMKGIAGAKSGFIGSLLGRGDLPTLDARQLNLHTEGAPVGVGSIMNRGKGTGAREAVDRLAARQRAMELGIDPELMDYYQHLAHHAVWDKTAGAKTTHEDLVRAMRGYAKGGAAEYEHKFPLELPKAPVPSTQEMRAIVDRVARQQAGEHVRGDTANNLAGRSMRESQRVQQVPYELKPTKELRPTPVYNAREGDINVVVPGDQTVSDVMLKHVNNVPINSQQEGGSRYGEGKLDIPEAKRPFWASGPGPAQAFQNKVTRLATLTGDDPRIIAYHLAMGNDANNFAMHLVDANLKAIHGKGATPESMDAFNRVVQAGAKGIGPFPHFPGVHNPDEAYEAMLQDPEMRKWFNNRMKTPNITQALGLPNGLDIDYAISHPELRNMEINMTGHSVGRMRPGAELIPGSAHHTYSHDIPGESLGRAPELAPLELAFLDATHYIKPRLSAPRHYTKTMQGGAPHQVVDERYLNMMNDYYHKLRQARGFADGGAVEPDKDTMLASLMLHKTPDSVNIKDVGVNEAPDLPIKAYVSPNGGSGAGLPIGGVDFQPLTPGNQLMPMQSGQQPGIPSPQSMGTPPMGTPPMGTPPMGTPPMGTPPGAPPQPGQPQSNILSLTRPGQAMQALRPNPQAMPQQPGPNMPKMKKGGGVEVKPTVKDETIQRKIPEMEDAVKALQAETITRAQYDKVVKQHKPVKPYEFVPQPATDEDAERALKPAQKDKWRGHEQWPAGRKVGLRLDIPAYENHGVWVNSIHDEEGSDENKYPTAYNSVSSVKNATFDAKPEKAVRVATGEQNKSPFARIKGELHHMTEDEAVEHMKANLNHPDYVQVGMDPRRHGFFYDRKTMKPVTHSAHVVQIGPLVLAHKPTYGKRETYAKGGDVKPVGYTKERVTVSPNLDAMRYEMESVKHYTKKVK